MVGFPSEARGGRRYADGSGPRSLSADRSTTRPCDIPTESSPAGGSDQREQPAQAIARPRPTLRARDRLLVSPSRRWNIPRQSAASRIGGSADHSRNADGDYMAPLRA